MRALFDVIVGALSLHPVADAVWHRFPGPGGVTGMLALAESHLTVHTFPEYGSMCLNLFCCTPRPRWGWESQLATMVGASEVVVRQVTRDFVRGSATADTTATATAYATGSA